jgi:hypothetical protein
MIRTLFRAVRSKGAYVNACTASPTSGKASVVAQHLNQRVDQRDSNLSGLLFEVAHCSFHSAVLRVGHRTAAVKMAYVKSWCRVPTKGRSRLCS